jgi:hypothetical protein
MLSHGSETLHMPSNELGEMFEGDFLNTCVKTILLADGEQ